MSKRDGLDTTYVISKAEDEVFRKALIESAVKVRVVRRPEPVSQREADNAEGE